MSPEGVVARCALLAVVLVAATTPAEAEAAQAEHAHTCVSCAAAAR